MTPVLLSKENNEAAFSMSFTAENFEEALQAAYKDNRGRFFVDGFRKGKAPRRVIEAKYGKEIFFDDALDHLFQKGYPEAVESLSLKPVGQPRLDFGGEKLVIGKDFTVTVTVVVEPEVEVSNYLGVSVEKPTRSIKEEDVDKEVEALAKRNARLVSIDGEAAEGDTVLLDYAGYVGEEAFEGGTAENQSLKLGSGMFIPGFEEGLIGIRAGEERTVEVTFPETYHSEELAGAQARFECRIHEVKREELPELDDEFAKDVSEFDTLEELRESLRSKLETSAAEAAEFEAKNAVMEKIYEANDFDLPQVMIEDQAEEMLGEFAQQLASQGMNLDMYCDYLQKTKEDVRQEMLPDAEKRVKARLIIMAIAQAEDIQASEEEIEEELAAMAKMYNMDLEKIRALFPAENMTYLTQDIRMRKAVDFVYEKAVVQEVEAADDQPAEGQEE